MKVLKRPIGDPSDYEKSVCGRVFGVIYKITQKSTGKVYIGQVRTLKKTPLQLYRYMGSGVYIRRSIEVHGFEDFSKEYLCECSDQEDLNQKEIKYIKDLNSLVPNGFNFEKGGWYVKHPNPEEEYRHHSEAMIKYYQDPVHREEARLRQIGRRHSEETKKQMSDTAKQNLTDEVLERISFKGKHHSEDTKEKLRNHRKGRRFIHNETIEKSVLPEELEGFLSRGWNLGRKPFSEEHKNSMRKPHKLKVKEVNLNSC